MKIPIKIKPGSEKVNYFLNYEYQFLGYHQFPN